MSGWEEKGTSDISLFLSSLAADTLRHGSSSDIKWPCSHGWITLPSKLLKPAQKLKKDMLNCYSAELVSAQQRVPVHWLKALLWVHHRLHKCSQGSFETCLNPSVKNKAGWNVNLTICLETIMLSQWPSQSYTHKEIIFLKRKEKNLRKLRESDKTRKSWSGKRLRKGDFSPGRSWGEQNTTCSWRTPRIVGLIMRQTLAEGSSFIKTSRVSVQITGAFKMVSDFFPLEYMARQSKLIFYL